MVVDLFKGDFKGFVVGEFIVNGVLVLVFIEDFDVVGGGF